ncbi:hypothetical protein EV421DRAFT_1898543 [Armillaria borealis]|uniref:Uncharacterized protein n=1 Tax=Armillaria borealis TaxID=47425 RepID=A0AA39MZ99_9AGAR|nr:hypothetical protein EV421DRAFT_1898543 [Armillaria borealis]
MPSAFIVSACLTILLKERQGKAVTFPSNPHNHTRAMTKDSIKEDTCPNSNPRLSSFSSSPKKVTIRAVVWLV